MIFSTMINIKIKIRTAFVPVLSDIGKIMYPDVGK